MIKTYTKEQIFDFLNNSPIMSVAVNLNDKPISSILIFAIDKDFTFYFATHQTSYKAKALETNPQISMCVWEHNQMLVQASGAVERLSSEKEINKALDKIAISAAKPANFWPPVLRLESNAYAVYKIKTNWIRALNLSGAKVKDEDPPFTEFKLE